MKPFADHFSRISSGYAAFRPQYPEELFDAVAGAASRRQLAWDCATGSGQAAGGLARRFTTVVATDASRAQIRDAAPQPNLRYAVATAEAAPLRNGVVDVVTVAQALHWLDLERFYAEARRVLAPGGLVAAWTYGRHHVDDGPIDRVLDRFYEDVVGPYWPPERRWVEAGYRGLPFPFREVSVAAPPMIEEWALDQMLGYIGTWSATVRRRERTGADPVLALAQEVEPLWGERTRRRRVRWDLTVRAGRT